MKVHELLEGCWGVTQVEQHHSKVKQPLLYNESSLVDILGVHLDLPLPRKVLDYWDLLRVSRVSSLEGNW